MKIPDGLKQLIIYFFVGIGATIVEWAVFYLLDIESNSSNPRI